jgi:hypothetical protein
MTVKSCERPNLRNLTFNTLSRQDRSVVWNPNETYLLLTLLRGCSVLWEARVTPVDGDGCAYHGSRFGVGSRSSDVMGRV